MTNLTDEELVGRSRKGDSAAFERLVERYERPVFNAALRIAGNLEDARDVTQNAFLKAYENLDRYDPRHRFFSWLYRIAVNDALNLVRRNGRGEPLGDGEPPAPEPGDPLARDERTRAVQDALMRMKADHRAVLVLRHFLECSYHDIGEILQVPEKTVKSRLFSARQLLKDDLARRGMTR